LKDTDGKTIPLSRQSMASPTKRIQNESYLHCGNVVRILSAKVRQGGSSFEHIATKEAEDMLNILLLKDHGNGSDWEIVIELYLTKGNIVETWVFRMSFGRVIFFFVTCNGLQILCFDVDSYRISDHTWFERCDSIEYL
jgi:hypothetical protein